MNNKPLNWSWYYPYSDAPLINDIIQIYEVQCEKSPLKFTITDQLKFILPSNSLKLTKRKPIFKDEINIGQIDVDSNSVNPFSKKDERFLEWINEQVATIL